MNPPTDKRSRWAWFAVLWCGGVAAAWLLAALARWVVSIG